MEYIKEAKDLLEELISPIPVFVRPMAKKAIEKKIMEVAKENGHAQIEVSDVLRGYILAGSGKDKERMKEFLSKKGIDLTPYADILG
jgi:hypothetical protein